MQHSWMLAEREDADKDEEREEAEEDREELVVLLHCVEQVGSEAVSKTQANSS